MKVLIFGTGTLDCAAANCGIALSGMGHEIVHFDPEAHPAAFAPIASTWSGRVFLDRVLERLGNRALWWKPAFFRCVSAFRPHLILTTRLDNLSRDTVATAKKLSSAKIAGWYQDHIVNFGSHQFVGVDYDGLFFKDPYIVERLRDYAGMEHVHFLPEACEPRVHHTLRLTAEDLAANGCDVMTYGNTYAYRLRLLETLSNLDFRLYGGGAPRWLGSPLARTWQEKAIFRDEKIKAVLAAKIVVSSSHFGEVRSANARVFEVAGIGGFQLADAPGVGDYFVPGEEIVQFKGPAELRQLIAHYIPRPDERREFAKRAQARAYRDHTYERRLEKLLATLGFGGAPHD